MNSLRFSCVLVVTALGFTLPTQAQLSNLFSSSAGSSQGQTLSVIDPGLPTCPPLVAGVPETPAPNGQSWSPGVNCVLGPATGQQISPNSVGSAPLNTVDPTLVSDTTVQNTIAGDAAYSANGVQTSGTRQQFDQVLGNSQGRIGISYVNWPDYLGARNKDWKFSVLLDVEIGAGGFLNNEDGLGWRLISLDAIESKVSLNWNGNDKVRGFPKLHFEADAVYSTFTGTYELEYSQPIGDGKGWTLTGAILTEFAMPTGNLTTRLGLTHASKNWMNEYYDGNPGGGLRDAFIDAVVDIPIGQQMGVEIKGTFRRFLVKEGDLKSNGSTDGSNNNFIFGASYYYRF